MKKLAITILFLLTFAFTVSAQKTEVDQSFVDDATKAFEEVVALRAEVKALKEAREADETAINKLKVELARYSGELTGEKNQNIQNRAVIEFLLKNGRKKCYGICLQF